MSNTESPTDYDRFMDAPTQQKAECLSLITPTTAHVKCHINKVEDEQILDQWLQKQFLEYIYQSPLASLKVEAGDKPSGAMHTTQDQIG